MMTKIPTKIFAALAAFLLVSNVCAQVNVLSATRSDKLEDLSDQLSLRDYQDKLEAGDAAQRLGIPVRRQLPDGRVLELQRFRHGLGPEFYITNNIDAADTVSTDEVWPGGAAGLNLDGFGMTVGEWDGGAIALHPDFGSRLTQVDGATTVSNHSTHVAGTLVGSGGGHPDAIGMAHAADLDAYDWNSDTAEMALAAANGLLVSNHSYGIAAGWLYIGGQPPDQWWWIGGDQPSDIEDRNFGYYDSESQLWDQIAFDAPYYLIVKASGNDRSDFGAAPGEEYTVIDQDGNFLFTSTLPRNPDCAPAGYDCLPGHSVAKNILTVGAVDDLPGGYSGFTGPSSVVMSDFSSWGPTDDGRIKPDVVGNGVLVFSTWGDYPYYALAIGTSMATPNVTGSLSLLQQHYENVNGANNFMRSATLKALAIHTADESGDSEGPDYEFGWGLLNTKKATDVISGLNGDHQIVEAVLDDGGSASIPFTVSQANSIVRVTLAWTDPPGTPPAPTLDPPDLMLVNDLDMRVNRGGSTWFPWVLNPAAPADAATTGDNFRDNVEQVVITGAGAGNYQVDIDHKGSLLNNQGQAYSVIISVTQPPPLTSQLLIDEDFSGGLPPGWSVSTTNGVPWTIQSPVPGGGRYDNNTGGSGQFAMVDVNYSAFTRASLVTSAYDLSMATAAVLRFNSYFLFDIWESINVDVSTNGGGTWTNVWSFSGFNPFPSVISLDLSGTLSGQPDVRLRWRFDSWSDPAGNLWQIDNIEFEVFGAGPPPPDPPGIPGNPVPGDGAVDQGLETDLSWTAGSMSDSHDVYFGTSNPLTIGDFQINQPGTVYDPGMLSNDTTYYWRIDEINEGGTTEGPTWSFTTEAAEPPPPPPPSTDFVAENETAIAGSVSGSHADTHIDDGVMESIQERESGGRPSNRYSYLEHHWSFNVSSGMSVTVFANAWGSGSGDEDSFDFEYSLDGGANWSLLFNVSAVDSGNMQSFEIPGAPGGSILVRVVDTDQTQGNRGLDTVYVDHLHIQVANPSTDPPDGGPLNLNATSASSSRIDLAWTDGASNETGYLVERSPDGSANWVEVGNLGANSESFSDVGLSASTTYYYRVSAHNSNGSSAYATDNATTDPAPPLSLSAFGHKVKGEHHIDLNWTGSNPVDIYRNGSPIATGVPGNSFTDATGNKGGGSYDHQVCEAGSITVCSNITTTIF